MGNDAVPYERVDTIHKSNQWEKLAALYVEIPAGRENEFVKSLVTKVLGIEEKQVNLSDRTQLTRHDDAPQPTWNLHSRIHFWSDGYRKPLRLTPQGGYLADFAAGAWIGESRY